MANEIKATLVLEGKDAIRTVKALEKGIDNLGKTGTASVSKMSGAMQVFQGVVGAQVLLKSIDLIGSALKASAKNALEFGEAVQEINSIAPRTAAETLALKNQLIGLSNEFGGSAQKNAKAFYNIVSAGVKGTAKQLAVLETANKAAVAGLVDIDTSAKVLVASVNSYATSGLTATAASDILFATVKAGITTFTELAGSIGTVAPLASAAGLSFSELGGSLAFITKSGVSTAEAATGIRATLVSIIKPSEGASKAAKQMGIDFSTAAIRTKGFAGFMQDVITKTGGTEAALAKLFPNVRALNAVIQIAKGDFQDFKNILDETAGATGATEKALLTITDSAGFQFKKLTNQLSNFPTAILTNFEKPISDALKIINEFVSTQGVLAVVDAVDTLIDAFDGIQIGVANTKVALAAVAAGAAELGVQWTELALSVNEAVQSTQKFLRLDVSESLKEEEANLKSRIAGLRDFQKAQEEGALAEIKAAEETSAKVNEFRKTIADGRRAQAKLEDEIRAEQKQKDTDAAQEQLEAAVSGEKNKQQLLQDIKEASILLDQERAEEQKIGAELKAEEEFIFLEEALGREQALRELFRIQQIDDETKRIEALKGLREKAEKEKAKKDKITLAQQLKLDQTTAKAKADLATSTANLIAAVSKDGSKAAFLAQKAAAVGQSIVSTQAAAAQALAVPPAPNLALASIAQTTGNINTAAILATAIKGFQSGGIVNGSQVGDQNVIGVNGDEAVFNKRQQQTLFNAVNDGSIGGGGGAGNITVNVESSTGTIPQEQIDLIIDNINDRVETGNKVLGAA